MDAHVRAYRERHPGDPRAVMLAYRRHILSCKRRWGTARGLVHYRGFIETYLWAKRGVCQRDADTTVRKARTGFIEGWR